MDEKKKFVAYARNFIFGVEDSLVSTVGLLAGIASAGVSKPGILTAGIVLIFVEAFSMAVGSFLSEQSVAEYVARSSVKIGQAVRGGSVMFFSYFVSGFIPLFPYILWEVRQAFWISIILSLAALFLLGFVSAKAFHTNILRSGFRMLLVGGFAILVGVVVGNFLNFR